MKEAWYSSIPRLIAILVAIALYGVALFSIFRRSRRVKLRSSEDTGRSSFGYSGPERRLYPRARLDVWIRYRVYSHGSGLNIFKEGKAVDISEGGIGILLETSEKLAVNDKLELKLKLPVTTQFMLIRGDVVWTREIVAGKWYRYGISFTEIDPNDKKMIAKYVTENLSSMESGG